MRCDKCEADMSVVKAAELRRYSCACGHSATTIEVDPQLIYGLQSRLFWSERHAHDLKLKLSELGVLV